MREKKELGGNNLCWLMEGERDCIKSHEISPAAVVFVAGEEKSCRSREGRKGLI